MEPITLALIAAGGLWLMSRQGHKAPTSQFPIQSVTGKSGKKWLSQVISITGSGDDKRQVIAVYAPAGAYGTNPRLWVVSYEQLGADKTRRRVVDISPQASTDMVTDAGKDFGIKKA